MYFFFPFFSSFFLCWCVCVGASLSFVQCLLGGAKKDMGFTCLSVAEVYAGVRKEEGCFNVRRLFPHSFFECTYT